MEIVKKYPKIVISTIFLLAFLLGYATHSFVWGQILVSRISKFLNYAAKETKVSSDTEIPQDIGSLLQEIRTEEKAPISSPDVGIAYGENILVLVNQPAGERVVMSMVSLETSGWVAIHEKRSDGTWGSILGARKFSAEKSFAQSIELLRATMEGATYVAVLHYDDGDGFFDIEREKPLTNAKGNFIQAEFIATQPVGFP